MHGYANSGSNEPEFDSQAVHWFHVNGAIPARLHNIAVVPFTICFLTSMVLYVGPLEGFFGHREWFRETHVISGVLSVAIVLVGFTPVLGSEMVDLWRTLMFWSEDDSRWFHTWMKTRHRPQSEIQKLNGGQKVASAVIGASMLVLLVSGLILRFFRYFPLWMRAGSTLAHTSFFYLLSVVVVAHISFVAQAWWRHRNRS